MKKKRILTSPSEEVGEPKEENARKKSVILFVVDLISNFIYNSIIEGFFGYLCTSYSAISRAFKQSFIYNYFTRSRLFEVYLRRLREKLSGGFENSWFIKKFSLLIRSLFALPVRSYGSFLMSFGIYSIVIYFVKLSIISSVSFDIFHLVKLIAICFVALNLLMVTKPLSVAIFSSRITNYIFSVCMCIREDAFEIPEQRINIKSNVMTFLGMLVGMLTLFFDPILILGCLLVSVLCCVIMCVPEVGVVSSLFLIPFFGFLDSPSLSLAILVLITFFSYLIKLTRGKRIIRFELVDVLVLVFGIMILLSGYISAGGIESRNAALISLFLMLGYFLIVNLVRTEAMLCRCKYAVVVASTIVALIGIGEYVFGLSSFAWLDSRYFSDIAGRATSLFENPNVLGVYLSVGLIFSLNTVITVKAINERLLSFFSFFSILACIVLTWSRGAWLAVLLSLLLFLVLFTRKSLRVVISAAVLLPTLALVLPNTILSRFLSIGNLSDSSISYRIYTWKGCFKMLKDCFMGGVGYGNEAFQTVYSNYSYSGIENAEHSHNLILQILISMGICGLIVFGILMSMVFFKNLEYIKEPSDRSSYLFGVAAICSLAAFVVMSLFDYVWYNYRVFYLFWCVIALSVANVRIGKSEIRRNKIIYTSDASNSSVELNL